MSKQQKLESKNNTIDRLRKILKDGDTVYTTVVKASSNGMSRQIKAFIVKGGEIQNISWDAADATGRKLGSSDGVIVGGCGMDMGFYLVHTLSQSLEMANGGYSLNQRWL